ncbi:MAG TPA: prolyl oligopeptidase family serine peptidase, partial [Bacteroidota bacterium]|nr:prolyl oligopeptidase family serine peptidase [Bacteroidota bacterium]
MKNFILAALLLAASAFSAQAQSTAPVVLTTGLLLAAAPPAPSQTISPNAVIATLETGSWKTPSANEPFDSDNKALGAWRTITAETDGWFRDSSLGYAYVSMTYRSDKEQIALIEAHGNSVVYVNGLARAGNIYGFQDTYESWGPRFDYVYIPVKLRKGVNEFVFECRRGLLKVKIHPDQNKLFFAVNDLTAPDLLIGEAASTFGALPIVNATEQSYTGLFAKTWAEGSVPEYYPVGELLPLSILKAPFAIKLPAQQTSGPVPFHVEIVKKNQGKDEVLASSIIELHSMAASETHKVTFFSAIDGSLQYYAVNPPVELKGKPALFLSLHGAGVEAINQAQAYGHKNWGYIVAATNRRPYGYNWENWGRLDALEVLAIAKEKFSIDPNRVYLTGHSMGGHGAWQLGVNYADQFAAVGPSAGWISIWSYRIRPVVDSTEVQKMLVRATKQSDTYAFTTNLKRTGLYILQGAVDDNVPPSQPRSIVENLSKFHKDFIYYEEPGAGHWWDNSDEPGSDCVDWMPMFDFFSHHAVASSDKIKMVDFVTANPAVSSKQYWIEVINQIEQQKLSTISMRLEQGNRKFVGSTGNIALFSIDCSMLSADKPVSVVVDSQTISNVQIP